MNCALFDSLSTADRLIAFSHPEYGALTVDWVIHQMAGHLIHHLKQLEAMTAREPAAGGAGQRGQVESV
jgi:hypothetical protein